MEETHNKSKTAVRRKEKLKERSMKKKQAKKGDVYEEVRIVLSSVLSMYLNVPVVRLSVLVIVSFFLFR